jgi:hypothetical protein
LALDWVVARSVKRLQREAIWPLPA